MTLSAPQNAASMDEDGALNTPLLTAVLVGLFALVFPLGYAWDLGFSGLAALAGLLAIPALRKARPPVRVVLPLAALVAWAVFSMTWSRAAVDIHSAAPLCRHRKADRHEAGVAAGGLWRAGRRRPAGFAPWRRPRPGGAGPGAHGARCCGHAGRAAGRRGLCLDRRADQPRRYAGHRPPQHRPGGLCDRAVLLVRGGAAVAHAVADPQRGHGRLRGGLVLVPACGRHHPGGPGARPDRLRAGAFDARRSESSCWRWPRPSIG